MPVDRAEAPLVAVGISPLLPACVDPAQTSGLRARYEVRLRGGMRLGLAFAGRDLAVELPVAGPVDCNLSVDPATHLLVAYGPQSQWPGTLQGGLLAWRRRPWLAPRFARLSGARSPSAGNRGGESRVEPSG